MKTITSVVMTIVLILSENTALAGQAQTLEGWESQGRETLAAAGFRYDDTASLIRALSDDNEFVAVVATMFLRTRRGNPEIVAALRVASSSPREGLAVAAFIALQLLRATGWEDAAIELLQESKDRIVRIDLAGILAEAGRAEGWSVVREALTPDSQQMGLAMRSAARFHGLRTPEGTTIDAISEVTQLRTQLQQRGRSADVLKIDMHTIEADSWARDRARGQAR